MTSTIWQIPVRSTINFGSTYQQPKMLFWSGQKGAWTGFWEPKTSLSKILSEKSRERSCCSRQSPYLLCFPSHHPGRYRLAMQLKKNIVVVKHEDFVFPDMALLPDDMKPIVKSDFRCHPACRGPCLRPFAGSTRFLGCPCTKKPA